MWEGRERRIGGRETGQGISGHFGLGWVGAYGIFVFFFTFFFVLVCRLGAWACMGGGWVGSGALIGWLALGGMGWVAHG